MFTCRGIAPSQSTVGSLQGCPLLINLGMHQASLWWKTQTHTLYVRALAWQEGGKYCFDQSTLADRMHL